MSFGGLLKRKSIGWFGLGLALAGCSFNPPILHTTSGAAQLSSVSPIIETVTPSAGSTFGGAVVTVTGTGFQPNSTVAFSDGTPCLTVGIQGPTELTCTLPPHASGDSLLIVSTPGATNSSGAPFTFQSDLFSEIGLLAGSYTLTGTYAPGTGQAARMVNVSQFVSDGTYLYAGMGTAPHTNSIGGQSTLIAR